MPSMLTKSCLAFVLAAVLPIAEASPQESFCYKPTFVNPTTTTDDNCGTYTICPALLLCTLDDDGAHKDPAGIKNKWFPCPTYTGGTSDGNGGCTGGTLIGSMITLWLPIQDCGPANCRHIQPGEQG